MTKPNIAIVEGDPMIALLMNEFLTEEGYTTHVWNKSENAAQFIRATMPDLLILDLWIQRRGDGWGILEHLRQDQHTASIPVIICSTDLRIEHQRDMERSNVRHAQLQKPFAVTDFLLLVKQCLHTSYATVTDESLQRRSRDHHGTPHYPVYDGRSPSNEVSKGLVRQASS